MNKKTSWYKMNLFLIKMLKPRKGKYSPEEVSARALTSYKCCSPLLNKQIFLFHYYHLVSCSFPYLLDFQVPSVLKLNELCLHTINAVTFHNWYDGHWSPKNTKPKQTMCRRESSEGSGQSWGIQSQKFDKSTKVTDSVSRVFNRWCWNWISVREKDLDLYLKPYTKINSRWILSLNIKI